MQDIPHGVSNSQVKQVRLLTDQDKRFLTFLAKIIAENIFKSEAVKTESNDQIIVDQKTRDIE